MILVEQAQQNTEATGIVLMKLVGLMTGFAVLVWGASELLGGLLPWQGAKLVLSWVLGIGSGVVLTGVGLFDVPGVELPAWEMALGALIGGLTAVIASKGINDQIVMRFAPKLKVGHTP